MEDMRRPWHSYLLLFIGFLSFLEVTFRPMSRVTGEDPGALLLPGQARVAAVRPGSAAAQAGLRVGDVFLSGEALKQEPPRPELRWAANPPKPGPLAVQRGGRRVDLFIRPLQPPWPVRFVWLILKLLNIGLAALALTLFWQRPRDGRAVLLGLVLLSAPIFALPPGYWLLALGLAAHFFAIFPTTTWRRPWRSALGFYSLLLFGALVAGDLAAKGRGRAAETVFFSLALGYAGYGLLKVLRRWKNADPESRPVIRTLTVAAGAIVAAVLAGIWRPSPTNSDPYLPLNLLPALLFSGAVAHLVFRLRALEVQVMARRTLQYLLARWTLGTLFLIPGLFLVWRFGQISVSHEKGRPDEVLGYLVWMFLVAVLSGKRQEVLQNLDRRFFRDAEETRQALIRLAREVGEQRSPQAVLETLERGVRGALQPVSYRFVAPDAPPGKEVEAVVPVQRGDVLLGSLHLGARESGQLYTTEERGLLEAAAVQAATALENARLSAELLDGQRAELAARTAGVLAGAEEERRRLAADLHDQVLPELRQIAGEVERFRQEGDAFGPEAVSALEKLERDVRGTMDSVREVMEALRPSTLDMLGLSDALESYFRKGAARCRPRVAVSVRRLGEEPTLSADQSLALYRICQEAINNVLKHSRAARAGLEVHTEADRLTLLIWDDGCGLDPHANGARGHGLSNIRYRADLIGAAVGWSPREGGGTRFEVRLALTPLPDLAPQYDYENAHR